MSRHSDGGGKGKYARLECIRKGIFYGRGEKLIPSRQWEDFFCLEYCTDVELKRGTNTRKRDKIFKWNTIGFKLGLRKHRLKITERF